MYGLNDKYDFAFSIGGACACSKSLRRAGMQFASFPFDWLVNYKSVTDAAAILASGFCGLLNHDQMLYCGPNADNDKDIYQNRGNGIYFLHDFPKGGDFEREYPAVEDKYRRRAERFDSLMKRSRRVLMVYVTIPNESARTDAELIMAREHVSAAYPGSEVDFLVFSQKDGTAPDAAEVLNPALHLFRCEFDYRSDDSNHANVVNDRLVAMMLKRLVRKVSDYRTSEEKVRYRLIERRGKYDFYKASNVWELIRNKVYYKLMKHFQNMLERKGFSFG